MLQKSKQTNKGSSFQKSDGCQPSVTDQVLIEKRPVVDHNIQRLTNDRVMGSMAVR